jgi:hypothetical protein
MQQASGGSHGSPPQYWGPGGGIGIAAPLPPRGTGLPPTEAPPTPGAAAVLPPAPVPALEPPSSSPPPSFDSFSDFDEPPQPANAAATNTSAHPTFPPNRPDTCIDGF